MTRPYEKLVAFSLLGALIAVLLWLWIPLLTPQPPSQEEVMRRASVRLASGGGCTMIDTVGRTSYGITAAHCVGKVGSKVVVALDDKTVTGQVLSRDTDHDLALISVVAEVKHVTPVATRPLHSKVFYTINERGTFELGVKSEGEPRYDVVNRRMYARRVFTVFEGVCRPGDSGTGVFQDGKLVGVVTHRDNPGDSKVLMSPNQPALVNFMARSQKIVPLSGEYRSWSVVPPIPRPMAPVASPTPKKSPTRKNVAIQEKREVFEFKRGVSYSERENWEVAIVYYTEAIRLNNKYAAAWLNRGTAYREEGEIDKAISDYTAAIRWQPDFADAYYNRGVAYQERGDQKKADADFSRARKLKAKK